MDDTISSPERPAHRAARGHRWEQVELRPYKEDERALFKTVSRQILFSDPELHAELRYFEVAPGGFSTLERHEHMHAVMVLRGRGECLVGHEVRNIELHDLVTVPPWTWHQFRAGAQRAARLPVHGERAPRQAATADARRIWRSSARMKRSLASSVQARRPR